MGSMPIADPVAETLGTLAAALEGASSMPMHIRDAVGQVAALEQFELLRRRMEFCGLSLIRAVEAAGGVEAVGAPSMVALLQWRLRLFGREANARVRAAEALCPGRSLTGERIPVVLPELADAAATGEVSGEQVAVVLRTMQRLPRDLEATLRASVAKTMVEHARTFEPRALARIGRQIEFRLTPQDPDPADVRRRRGLSLIADLPGSVAIHGVCSSETAAILQTALEPFAKPAVQDDRTPAQRRIDALEELARHCLNAGGLPSVSGERPHVTLILDPAHPEMSDVGWAGPVRRENVEWLLCDSIVTPIETDENGVPHRIGDPSRTPPLWLRRAVTARDRGCAFPDCDRGAAWTDLHHVRHWESDGPHAFQNLVLLCGYHHKLVHQERWLISFIHRFPHFTPPRWIDPRQIPRRNYIHHPVRNLPMRT